MPVEAFIPVDMWTVVRAPFLARGVGTHDGPSAGVYAGVANTIASIVTAFINGSPYSIAASACVEKV
jgi:hypothetical protein